MFKFNRETFVQVLGLTQKQPWLEAKVDILSFLLADECNSDEKRALLIELLDRFIYLSSAEFQKKLEELAESICTDPSLNDDSTQIVAMAADSSADSSQYILYGLKPILERNNWRKYSHVNTFGKAFATYKSKRSHNNIVLIDEFVGTGQTVINRVAEINRQFHNAKISDFSIRVKVITATELGIENVRSAGINIEFLISIKKGISDFNPEDQTILKKSLMVEIESLLLEKYGDSDLPSLGYGESESLYSRDDGNTPNNVFPVFWWPFYKDTTSRQVLLTRAMGDA
ncbi:phosphoribosyltransferase-like protein [Aeromonas dhakensis]|uniref:phosphoribosyltransferase-like protein n=1 Tax=Aeromonas dhakensis TaxID=196024 RepID=UPI003B9DEFB3